MKTENLLIVMKVFAWIALVGLIINAGSIAISYAVSIYNPLAAQNLYRGLDLSDYMRQNFGFYSILVFYKIALYLIQAHIAYLIIQLLSSINFTSPFRTQVVVLMKKISYSILWVWGIAMLYNINSAILERSFGIIGRYMSLDMIFLAGIVYVLAQMFSRGIEIQSENELTI